MCGDYDSVIGMNIENSLNKSDLDIKAIAKILADIREIYASYPAPGYDRFANSFSHIFAGGYAAGYYSYLWAEMISCDLFLSISPGIRTTILACHSPDKPNNWFSNR